MKQNTTKSTNEMLKIFNNSKFILIRIMLFFALSFSVLNLNAQTQYTVIPTGGTAGNTNGTGGDPVCRFYNSIRYQVVYTVAELTASGMPANTVMRISYSF